MKWSGRLSRCEMASGRPTSRLLSILLDALSTMFLPMSVFELESGSNAFRTAAARVSRECKDASCFEIYLMT